MDNRSGKMGEEYAAQILTGKGYQILHRNYHSRFGEIDIIAQNEQFIVFVEVKTRVEHFLVHPFEAITVSKQNKIRKTAAAYLAEHPTALQPRFDAVALLTDSSGKQVVSVEYLESAFEAAGTFL